MLNHPCQYFINHRVQKKNLREIDFTENVNDNFVDTLEPASYWPAKDRFDYLYLPKELAVCCQQGVDGQ